MNSRQSWVNNLQLLSLWCQLSLLLWRKGHNNTIEILQIVAWKSYNTIANYEDLQEIELTIAPKTFAYNQCDQKKIAKCL